MTNLLIPINVSVLCIKDLSNGQKINLTYGTSTVSYNGYDKEKIILDIPHGVELSNQRYHIELLIKYGHTNISFEANTELVKVQPYDKNGGGLFYFQMKTYNTEDWHKIQDLFNKRQSAAHDLLKNLKGY